MDPKVTYLSNLFLYFDLRERIETWPKFKINSIFVGFTEVCVPNLVDLALLIAEIEYTLVSNSEIIFR